jgi:hypothetical protein
MGIRGEWGRLLRLMGELGSEAGLAGGCMHGFIFIFWIFFLLID